MAIKMIAPTTNCKYPRCEFIMDTDSDAADLPVTCASGSTALACDSGNKYIVNASGRWVQLGKKEEYIVPVRWCEKVDDIGMTIDGYFHPADITPTTIQKKILDGVTVIARISETDAAHHPDMIAGDHPMFNNPEEGFTPGEIRSLGFGKQGNNAWLFIDDYSYDEELGYQYTYDKLN